MPLKRNLTFAKDGNLLRNLNKQEKIVHWRKCALLLHMIESSTLIFKRKCLEPSLPRYDVMCRKYRPLQRR